MLSLAYTLLTLRFQGYAAVVMQTSNSIQSADGLSLERPKAGRTVHLILIFSFGYVSNVAKQVYWQQMHWIVLEILDELGRP
jgi:hypothetical protein